MLIFGGEYPGIDPNLTLVGIIGLIVFQFLSGPLSEETGWRGYALPKLQSRFNALISSILLGTIWACWHIPLWFVEGSSQSQMPFFIFVILNIVSQL
ncbi:MAG: CPBP family intramembrane metalloprotease [Candidatus Lokiarchaeota archaeon]|nr:CPBP family intramembrane metalloprotease [Candidatus Lokiarchaeota archaeon]